MRRHLLGLIAALFLFAGIVMWVSQGADIAWVCLRIGMVLAAMWLALPQVIAIFSRIPPWLIGLAAAAVLATALTKSVLVVIPLVIGICLIQFVGWLFKPPPSGRRRGGRPVREAKGRKAAAVSPDSASLASSAAETRKG